MLFWHLTLQREKSEASVLLVLGDGLIWGLLVFPRYTVLQPQKLSWLPVTGVYFSLRPHVGGQVLWVCSRLRVGVALLPMTPPASPRFWDPEHSLLLKEGSEEQGWQTLRMALRVSG